MAKIVIIGWYGTETIGDRAIFAGLLSLFAKTFNQFEVHIGSLFPILTQRTLLEDNAFYMSISQNKLIDISAFDSGNLYELNAKINCSDLIAIGGGPLCDNISAMYMLEYAFAKGYNKNKITAILGCGVGPFKSKEYSKVFRNIIKYSSLSIFRDENIKEMNVNFPYTLSCDPAVFAADYFKRNYSQSLAKEKVVAINFREIINGVDGLMAPYWKKEFLNFLKQILDNGDNDILLVPMHTFYVGGDDRNTMNELSLSLKNARLKVQNVPLSLFDTMKMFAMAEWCIGMRFHSVLLQTILNGNNYILDYTDPCKGKTINLLNQLGVIGAAKGRYVSLHVDKHINFEFNDRIIEINHLLIENSEMKYVSALRSLEIE